MARLIRFNHSVAPSHRLITPLFIQLYTEFPRMALIPDLFSDDQVTSASAGSQLAHQAVENTHYLSLHFSFFFGQIVRGHCTVLRLNVEIS